MLMMIVMMMIVIMMMIKDEDLNDVEGNEVHSNTGLGSWMWKWLPTDDEALILEL